MGKARTTPQASEAFDAEQDRHPHAVAVLRKLISDAELPEGGVERIEVFCHASGDATYRVWEPRAEESTGGYFEDV